MKERVPFTMMKTILLLATTIAGLLTLLTINKLDKRTKEGSATTVDTIPPLVASTITLVLYLVYDVSMLVVDDNLGNSIGEMAVIIFATIMMGIIVAACVVNVKRFRADEEKVSDTKEHLTEKE